MSIMDRRVTEYEASQYEFFRGQNLLAEITAAAPVTPRLQAASAAANAQLQDGESGPSDPSCPAPSSAPGDGYCDWSRTSWNKSEKWSRDDHSHAPTVQPQGKDDERLRLVENPEAAPVRCAVADQNVCCRGAPRRVPLPWQLVPRSVYTQLTEDSKQYIAAAGKADRRRRRRMRNAGAGASAVATHGRRCHQRQRSYRRRYQRHSRHSKLGGEPTATSRHLEQPENAAASARAATRRPKTDCRRSSWKVDTRFRQSSMSTGQFAAPTSGA
jgi:hypothetical protein